MKEAVEVLATIRKSWSSYKDYLKETHPAKEGEQWEFTCRHHKMIDSLLFPKPTRQVKIGKRDTRNRVYYIHGYVLVDGKPISLADFCVRRETGEIMVARTSYNVMASELVEAIRLVEKQLDPV